MPEDQAEQPSPKFAALRSRPFAIFWTGLLVSHTGTWMQSVAQGWLLYQLTNTPVWLGASSLAFALPMVVLPLLGGALADRIHRLSLIRGLQLAMAVAAAALAGLTYLGAVTAWHLAAFSLFQGIVLAFEGPARHATIPDLVDRRHLLSAVSLFQSTYQLGGFFGPALAGVILGVLGSDRIYALFALNSLTFLINVVALSFIPAVPRHARTDSSLFGSVTDGLRFVWGQPALRSLLVLITVAGVFGRSYIALMPVFARDILHTDARGLGYLTAAPGIGVVVGATLLAASGAGGHRGKTIVRTALIFAALLAAFASSRWIALSIPVLVVLGAATITLIATMSTTMQVSATDAIRGRVMSVWAIANVGLPSMGAMVTASAAVAVGAPLAVAAGAGLVAITAAVLGRRILKVA